MEGPIYKQLNPNDYSGILNLYLRCPKRKEVSLNIFATDYWNKRNYVIAFLKQNEEERNLESIILTANNIVEAYCTSENYSTLEDSTLVFQTFMEEYFHNLKVIADALNGTLNQGVAR